MSAIERKKIVILSTANFNAPLWTNKQHLASGLAAHFDVYYIESLGLRAPKFNRNDLLRILNFIKPKRNVTVNSEIKVINPWVIPFHKNRHIQKINRILMKLFARIKLKGMNQAILWTFSPVTYGLEDYFEKLVYHSVDFLETFPGISYELIIQSEMGILEKADVVIASSISIKAKLESIKHSKVILLENVADTSYFYKLNLNRNSCAIFAGNLSSNKVDFDIFEKLAISGIHVKLAGSIAIDGAKSEPIERILATYHNIEYLGELTLKELNLVFNECKVGIIPYLTNSHTNGIYPMKIHEYGAAGLCVVSTMLPSLKNLVDMPGLIFSDPSNFAENVRKQLENFSDTYSNSISIYSIEKSWKNRIIEIVKILEDLDAD